MGSVQNKIYQLLAELKEICEKNDIPYFLGGWTALYAFCQGYLEEETPAGYIVIWPKDAKKLINIIQKQGKKNRSLDYLGNNPNFPGFFLKYADESSTALNLYRYRGYQSHGISVNIHFLCAVLEDGKKKKHYDSLELGMISRNGSEENKGEASLKAKEYTLKQLEGQSPEKLFEEWVDVYSTPSKKVFCAAKDRPLFSMESDRNMFQEMGSCELAGESYSMPKDAEGYIKAMFGENYRQTLKKGMKYPRMYFNPDVSYKRLFEELGQDASDFIKENEEIKMAQARTFQEFSPYRSYIENTWNRVNAIAKMEGLKRIYHEECLKALEEAYEGGDYLEVYRILEPWHELNWFCKENGLKREDYIVSKKLEQMVEAFGAGVYPPTVE